MLKNIIKLITYIAIILFECVLIYFVFDNYFQSTEMYGTKNVMLVWCYSLAFMIDVAIYIKIKKYN